MHVNIPSITSHFPAGGVVGLTSGQEDTGRQRKTHIWRQLRHNGPQNDSIVSFSLAGHQTWSS